MLPAIVFEFIRFLGIGFLNTALDFVIFNFLSSLLKVYSGFGLGALNTVSFSIAVTHSYFWNKYWSFRSSAGQTKTSQSLGNFIAATVLGVLILGGVFVGAKIQASFWFYPILVLILAIGELFLWRSMKLNNPSIAVKANKQLFLFISITIVGILINDGIVALATTYIPRQFGLNPAFWSNLAKAAATGVSLIWNFVGYKLFVFKT